MYLERLWLNDFRNYESLELTFPTEGLTLLQGSNGQGKTNLIEAIGYAATFRSFRGAQADTLIRAGMTKAVVRGEGERDGRRILIETELAGAGKTRIQVNRQSLRSARETSATLLATVFSPDDLVLVKGGPAERRRYLDDLLSDSDSRMEALERDFERILKQRNALLRQASGRLTPEIAVTLDVWDSKMTTTGEALGVARQQLIERIAPKVEESYNLLVAEAHGNQPVSLQMTTDWREQDGGKGLAIELAERRKNDVARGITTVGPHRDDLALSINGMPARTQASQGEQRTLALSLRLASHAHLQASAGAAPILLLDDVFSELDDSRARLLLSSLPTGQTFLTTATGPPAGTSPELVISVAGGRAQ